MSQPPSGQVVPGTLSPDREWVWNGNQWIHRVYARFSPDGRFIWDGNQWIPNAAGQWVPPKSHSARNVGIGVLGCLGLGVIGIVVLSAIGNSINTSRTGSTSAVQSPSSAASTPVATPTTKPSPKPAGCTPQPCASAFSLTVRISGLNRNAPPGQFIPPEAGNHMVLMQMTMHNDGDRDTKHISPFDFKLRDAAGVAHDITFSDTPGCDTWSGVDLAPGASYGPKPLCFEAAGDPNGSLTLLWAPDVFGPTHEIRL